MTQISQQMLNEFEELAPDLQREVIDFVQFLKTKQKKLKPYDGQQVLELLHEGRQQKLFPDITDAAAWQKGIRVDRLLPGRD